MKCYWISCKKFTVSVDTDDDDIIVRTAAIVKRFRGQPLKNLVNWCEKKFGKVEIQALVAQG